MATMTAQILVGRPHPNHGGINPTHILFLSENSRPAWILNTLNIHGPNSMRPQKERRVVWIPTVDFMVHDALLMIGLYAVRIPELVEAAKPLLDLKAERIELYEEIDQPDLEKLHQIMKNSMRDLQQLKIILTLFERSSILSQMSHLKDYELNMEVCRPIYSRLFSSWTQDVDIKGSLD